jgi:pantothenate synthetase
MDILEPALTDGVVALVAAKLGAVRLIDNAIIGAPPQ